MVGGDRPGDVFHRMALQLMREKGMSRSEAGQLGFSVLLFQDLGGDPGAGAGAPAGRFSG